MELEGNVRLELPCIAYCLVVGEGFDRSVKNKHKQPMLPDGLGFCPLVWIVGCSDFDFFAVVLTSPNHTLSCLSDRQDDDIAYCSCYSLTVRGQGIWRLSAAIRLLLSSESLGPAWCPAHSALCPALQSCQRYAGCGPLHHVVIPKNILWCRSQRHGNSADVLRIYLHYFIQSIGWWRRIL